MNNKELIDKINSILINKLKFLYDTTENHYFNEIEEVNEEDEKSENYIYRFLISILEEDCEVKIKFYKLNLENEEI